MNNIKHFIQMMYNETIHQNKGKEVILLDNKIMYGRKTTCILDVVYEDGCFRTPKYTLISLSSDDIKTFLSSYKSDIMKNIRGNKIYCFYNDSLYFLECQKNKEWHLYNLSNEGYSHYYII